MTPNEAKGTAFCSGRQRRLLSKTKSPAHPGMPFCSCRETKTEIDTHLLQVCLHIDRKARIVAGEAAVIQVQAAPKGGQHGLPASIPGDTGQHESVEQQIGIPRYIAPEQQSVNLHVWYPLNHRYPLISRTRLAHRRSERVLAFAVTSFPEASTAETWGDHGCEDRA